MAPFMRSLQSWLRFARDAHLPLSSNTSRAIGNAVMATGHPPVKSELRDRSDNLVSRDAVLDRALQMSKRFVVPVEGDQRRGAPRPFDRKIVCVISYDKLDKTHRPISEASK